MPYIADLQRQIENWDMEDIEDLRELVDRMKGYIKDLGQERAEADKLEAYLKDVFSPEVHLSEEEKKFYFVWACDKEGRCLTGANADKIKTVEQIKSAWKGLRGT